MGQANDSTQVDVAVAQKRHTTDARQVHPTTTPGARLWADLVPMSWRPYVQLSRIDMLSGLLMFFWPNAWGILASAYRLGTSPVPVAIELALHFVGTVILHSAACTWNDICDKDFDAKVERTKYRPLPAGTVSVGGALLFIVPHVAILLGLLSLTNKFAFQMGVMCLCVWQPIYPLMKRVTYWPQAWLGFVTNWGIVIAWLTHGGTTDIKPLIVLFLGCCCWTVHYDTMYAMQDTEDDRKAGVKSTAVLFGTSARPILAMFCVGMVVSLAYFGILTNHGPAYFIFSVLGTAAHLFWQVATLDPKDPRSCFAKFDANGSHVGWIVSSGIAIDYALKLLA